MLRIIKLTLVCLVFGALAGFAQKSPTASRTPAPAGESAKKNARPAAPPKETKAEPFEKATVEQMAAQCVRLETEAGAIELEMLPEFAPESVRNFLNLAAIGAYNTTEFSRVVPGFIIQGGNLGTSEKWSHELAKRAAKTIPDEPSRVLHERGIVSMARTGEPNSATTHFFILVGKGSHLDGTFAAFARVKSGMEIVDAINKMPVENETPAKPVKLTRASVFSCSAPATKTNSEPAEKIQAQAISSRLRQ